MTQTTQVVPDFISIEEIYQAKMRLQGIVEPTPLTYNLPLSDRYGAEVYLKREDLQVVRSYKIRGAYHKMATLTEQALAQGVVCASAGNHAQGVAYACRKLQVPGTVFMPGVTPQQKVKKVRWFGQDYVEVVLTGDTFDDAYEEALRHGEQHQKTFIHPFNDRQVMAGQGTVGLEILENSSGPLDYVIAAVGGGGLMSGMGSYLRQVSPQTRLIGVEPAGAPAMTESIRQGRIVTLEHIDPFVDGAAVKRVGDQSFALVRQIVDAMEVVEEGKVCSTILQLYNEEGLVVEPAGALSIAVLDQIAERIRGKRIVCIVGGGNNDITRTEEIRERALLFEGRKHYFIIRFPQRSGALRDFLNNVLGPDDDITHFEYTKKHNRETGPALVGIQVPDRQQYQQLVQRMDALHINYQHLNDSQMLFDLLV